MFDILLSLSSHPTHYPSPPLPLVSGSKCNVLWCLSKLKVNIGCRVVHNAHAQAGATRSDESGADELQEPSEDCRRIQRLQSGSAGGLEEKAERRFMDAVKVERVVGASEEGGR